ncbi:hypothetical protein CC80DRAFT_550454 [Byssothecium circinans]|uniref:Uncharacterized protein n=1 Tax=Byssothecium circinans TaxID=147558 RepID=A0A6A5TRT6_9PLEO|nr:hypothetical protein CC80DRAFT_550454 [Byssothecium circinans]
MSQAPQSSSKRSSRDAATTAKDTNIVQAVEGVMDPSATPRPVCAKGNLAPGPPAPPVPVSVLDETEMPALTPSASEHNLDIFRYGIEQLSGRTTADPTYITSVRATSKQPYFAILPTDNCANTSTNSVLHSNPRSLRRTSTRRSTTMVYFYTVAQSATPSSTWWASSTISVAPSH